MTETTVPLPMPEKQRWQPLRSGLINLFLYDNEEFLYTKGRLLLRGNNGTGKSRFLALQLPFLLDGEINASRVEPDGDSAKRMEWHLLMDRHTHRMGYTWIEFGRLTEHGQSEFCTLGCGMEVSKGGKLNRWPFITRQRIGGDLALVRSSGAPVPKDALANLLEGKGTIYQKVGEYRKAVDDHLFHLGEERYLALVNLLIQLRKPQLSRDLDERKLSKALSDSLPPLDARTIADVAEAFRELERDRDQLGGYIRCVEAVKSFDRVYREYAKIAVGRNADQLRSAHNAYENKQKATRKAESDLADAQAQEREARNTLEEVRLELERAEGEQQALQDSAAMQSAQELDRREAEAQAAQGRSARTQEDYKDSIAKTKDRQNALQNSKNKVVIERRMAQDKSAQAVRRAGNINLTLDFTEQLRNPATTEDRKKQLLNDLAQYRENHHYLSTHQKRLAELADELSFAERTRSEAEARLSSAKNDEAEKHGCHQQESKRLVDATRRWLMNSTILLLPDTDSIIDSLQQWCESPDRTNPFRAAVDEHRTVVINDLAQERSGLAAQKIEIEGQKQKLSDEKADLESGEEVSPPVPHTRDTDTRLDRPGVPLWQACDFHEEITMSDRAKYEAALEASGILDAWITPEGTIVDPHGDTLIDLQHPRPLPERSLCHVLRPAINPDHPQHRMVSTETIETVLALIAIDDGTGSVFVTSEGTWCNGILSGAWSKPEAEFIGAGAREAARQRRLTEITDELESLDSKLKSLEAKVCALDEQQLVLDSEWHALPCEEALHRSMADWNAATALVSKSTEDYDIACGNVHRLKEEHKIEREKYLQMAAELGLGGWADRLAQYKDGLQAYSESLSALWPALRMLLQAQERVAQAESELHQAELWSEEIRRRSSEAKAEAERKSKEYETLRETAGAEIRKVKEKLGKVRERIVQLKRDVSKNQDIVTETATLLGQLSQKVGDLTEQLAQAESERSNHIEAFRIFASTGMLEELGETPDGIVDWSPTRLVEYVRSVYARIGAKRLSDEAWDKMCNTLHAEFQKLQSELSARNLRAESEQQHHIDVVSVEYNGKSRRVHELLDLLETQVRDRKQLLSAKERNFIENHLIAEVAEHLHALICQAAELVSNMNAELTTRPTSTGMRLRFQWEPVKDGAPGTEEACALLRRKRATWSEQEQAILAKFLHDRITEMREASEGSTWRENLEEAVDYRAWHQFYVERHQNGVWKKLTKRTHGTGSGGEKALALTIPQFAAAAAHYHTIPHAPRLIMLDEVFAGIDRDMRDKCMGLLETFDLDFVMTSESEWGCYPSISGLSICQLATQPGYDAVAVIPWQWNGKEKVRTDSFFTGADNTLVPVVQEGDTV